MNKKKIIAMLLSVAIVTSGLLTTPKVVQAHNNDINSEAQIGVSYQAHVQNLGWQPSVLNGAEAGTNGQSLRLEALKINLINAPKDAKINYQAHVQNQGWQSWKSNGAEAGTEGKSLRAEAIKISLENLPGYSVQYRAHVQNQGWQPWVSNGAVAGTIGKSLRLEALEIRIVKTSVQSIAITKTANKLTYTLGDKLDISGLEVTETYADGTKAVVPITAANVTGFDSSKAVNGQVLTVTVGDKTATYTVNVNPKQVTYTGYIQDEDCFVGFVDPTTGKAEEDPGNDSRGCLLMKSCAGSGYGITVKQEDGTYKYYYFDGEFASGTKTNFVVGTGTQKAAWDLIQNTKKQNHVTIKVTGTIDGSKRTNTNVISTANQDDVYYPVIKVTSLEEITGN